MLRYVIGITRRMHKMKVIDLARTNVNISALSDLLSKFSIELRSNPFAIMKMR